MRPKLNTRLDEGSALGDSTPDRERSKLLHTLFASTTFNCIHLSIPFDATLVRSDSHSHTHSRQQSRV